MADFIGSSGTLIGAALETAGYYYQSWLIDAMGTPFASAMGSLLYIVAVLIGIISYVLMGEYKFSVWLLLGPGLFYFCLFDRTDTAGSDWQFGGEPRDRAQLEEQVIEQLKGVDKPYQPKISRVFAYFNALVSTTVSSLVDFLNADRKEADKKFLIRAQLYTSMASPVVQEAGFRMLVQRGFLAECNKVLEKAQEMAEPANRGVIVKDPENEGQDIEKQELLGREYAALVERRHIRLKNLEAKYLASLRTDYGELFDMVVVSSIDDEIANMRSLCYEAGAKAECKAPANSVTEDYLPEVEQKEQATSEMLAPYADKSGAINPDTPKGEEVKGALEKKAQEDADFYRAIQAEVFSCRDIWNFVYAGLHRETKRIAEKKQAESKAKGISEESTLEEFKRFTNQDSPLGIARFIAKHLFRAEFNKRSISALMAPYEQHTDMAQQLALPPESNASATERMRVKNREYDSRMRAMVSAATLPYYQGLGLYLLSIAYPFFCFLLIIPGKHQGFFLWFVLWAWLKCWDLGFAIVMLLDDILFSLFVTNMQSVTTSESLQLSPDLPIAIWSMREMDPTFNLATYYNIIAVALHAIPTILSYLIIGGLTGGVGLIAAGAKQYIGPYVGAEGASGISMPAMMVNSQMNIDAFRGLALRNSMKDAVNKMNNDSGGRTGEAASLENSKAAGRRFGYFDSPMSAAGSATDRSSGYMGMGVDELAKTSIGLKVAAGAARGAMSGASSGPGGRSDSVAKGAKGFVGRAAKFADDHSVVDRLDAAADAMDSFYIDRLALRSNWGEYDSLNSNYAQALAGAARIHGMFEMPWNTGTGGWEQEWDYEMNRWKKAIDTLGTSLKSEAVMILDNMRQEASGKIAEQVARANRAESGRSLSEMSAEELEYYKALGLDPSRQYSRGELDIAFMNFTSASDSSSAEGNEQVEKIAAIHKSVLESF